MSDEHAWADLQGTRIRDSGDHHSDLDPTMGAHNSGTGSGMTRYSSDLGPG